MKKITLLLCFIVYCLHVEAQEITDSVLISKRPTRWEGNILDSSMDIFTEERKSTSKTTNRPFQFSVYYPVGTDGKNSINHRYNFSFNLGYGCTGGINGLEISGLAGITDGTINGAQINGLVGIAESVNGLQLNGLLGIVQDVRGIQLNGLVGLAETMNGIQLNGLIGMAENTRGLQVNGLVGFAQNVTGLQVNGLVGMTEKLNGIQINGLVGMAERATGLQVNGLVGMAKKVNAFQVSGLVGIAKNTNGMQLSGLIGIANNVKGLQFSGLTSIANNTNGIQISGLAGIANDTKGLQFSGLANVANEMKGVQIAGLVNRTNKLKGFQFALVNITNTVECGVPMGLVSIVKRGGYHQWEIYSSDIVNAGVSYKLGIRKFYSIYSVGYNFLEDQLWVAGFGFGSNIPFNNNYEFQPELVSYSYFPTDFKDMRYTSAVQLKLGFVRKFGKIGVLVAPTVYWAVGDREGDEYGYKISPITPVYTHTSESNKQSLGIGYTIGVTF